MQTQTIASFKNPLGSPLEIIKQTFSSSKPRPVKRISFVAGIHGDELEGIYICHRLINFLKELKQSRPDSFKGEINIYPAANPAAVNSSTRMWPFFSRDINRFVGNDSGSSLVHQISKKLLEDLIHCSDIAVDIHASNTQLRELPQIRIIEKFSRKLLPLANFCNMDLVWVHPMAEIFESTLGYNLNRAKVLTLVVETGTCNRIDLDFSDQIFSGMLNLLYQAGILDPPAGKKLNVKQPQVIKPKQVAMINARSSGLFIKTVSLGHRVQRKEIIGHITDPVFGTVLEEVTSSSEGWLFTLREHPLTHSGALLGRVALDFDIDQ